MADLDELLKLMGKPAQGALPGAVVNLGVKLTKLPGEDEDGPLLGRRGMTSDPRNAFDSFLVAPRAYVESTDLSLWPFFSNVGSYLRAHQALPSWLDHGAGEFALNVAADPSNLLTLGAGGLLGKTVKGAGAALITAFSAGGKITEGAATVERIAQTLEGAAKIAGRSEDIVAAAKAGNTRLVKSIVKEALEADSLLDADRAALMALRKEAKGLGRVLQDVDKLATREVSPFDLLGESYRERVRLGQVNPFVSVIKPDWKNPVKALAEITGAYDVAALPLHFLGVQLAGHNTWTPTSKLFSAAFDAVGIGGLRGAGVEIVQDMKIGPLMDKIDSIASTAGKTTARELSPYHFGVSARRALLTAGMPLDHVLRDVTGIHLPDGEIDKLFRERIAIGRSLKAPVTDEEREFMRGLVNKQLAGELTAHGVEAKLARAKTMDELLTQTRSQFAAENAGRAAQGLQALDTAMLHADIDDLMTLDKVMSLDGILADPLSPGGGLANRSSLSAMYASNTTAMGRQLLLQDYDRNTANAINRTLDLLVANDHKLVLNDAGRLVFDMGAEASAKPGFVRMYHGGAPYKQGRRWLTPDRVYAEGYAAKSSGSVVQFVDIPENSGLLRKAFDDSGTSIKAPYVSFEAPESVSAGLKPVGGGVDLTDAPQLAARLKENPAVETLLRGEGLSPAVTEMARWQRTALDTIGQTAMEAGTIAGMHGHYFPMVFKPSGKFWETFGLSPRTETRFLEMGLERGPGGAWVRPNAARIILGDTDPEGFLAKMRQGKVTMAETRQWTEEMAVRAEEAGLGTYKRDSLGNFGRYLHAASQAQLVNRLWRDMPNLPLGVTEDMVRRDAPRLIGLVPRETWAGAKRFVERPEDIPKGMENAYQPISLLPRWMRGAEDIDAIKATAKTAVVRDLEASGAGAALRETSPRITAAKDRVARLEGILGDVQQEGARKAGEIRDAFAAKVAAAEGRAEKDVSRLGAQGQRAVDALERMRLRDEVAAEKAVTSMLNRAEKLTERAGALAGDGRRAAMAAARDLTKDAESLLGKAAKRRDAVAKGADALVGQVDRAKAATIKAIEARRKELAKAVAGQKLDEARRIGSTLKGEQESLADVTAAKASLDDLRKKLAERGEEYAQRLTDAAKNPPSEPEGKTLYVWKGDAPALREAFHLYEREGYSGFLRAWDNFNNAIRPIVLMGDLFFFGTIGLHGSFLGNPLKSARALGEDFMRLGSVRSPRELMGNAVGKMVLGAAGGAALGPLVGAEDGSSYAALAAVGALYGAAIGTALKGGRSVLGSMGHPMAQPVLRRMGLGGWTGRPDDASIGLVQEWMDGLLQRIRSDKAGPVLSALKDPLTAVYNGTQNFDTMMWGTLHNNGKIAYFDTMWSRQFEKLSATAKWKDAAPDARQRMERELSAELVQMSNNAFSSQSYSKLFASPEWERWSKRFFVAPSYFYSRLQMTSAMLANMSPIKGALAGSALGVGMELADQGFDPETFPWKGAIYGAAGGAVASRWATNVVKRLAAPGDAYRAEAWRLAGAALVGGFATYNLLNRAFTGHWMWENEEGHKLDVALPNGMFFHPGRAFTSAWDFAGIHDTQRTSPPVLATLANKLSPALQTMRVVFNRDWQGGPIIVPSDMPWDVAYKYGVYAIEQTAPAGLENSASAGLDALQRPLTAVDALRSVGGVMGFPLRGRPTGGQLLPLNQDQASGALFNAPPPSLVGNPPLLSGSF